MYLKCYIIKNSFVVLRFNALGKVVVIAQKRMIKITGTEASHLCVCEKIFLCTSVMF